MVQQSWPYKSSPVTFDEWSKMARLWRRSGVVDDADGELEVTAVTGELQVQVAAGEAWLDSVYFASDAAETLNLDDADLNDDRIDLVVVRSDRDAGEATLQVITGTPAASPSAPTVTQDHEGSDVYEIALAEVLVQAAASDVDGQVTDVRTFSLKPGDVLGDLEDVDDSGGSEGDALVKQADGDWAPGTIDTDSLRTEYLELIAGANLRLWQLEADVIQETEGFAGWQGEAFLTNQDEVETLTGDIDVARAARLGGGGATIAASPIQGLSPGDAFMGGFFVGVIDTTRSNIITADQYQSGERYALIVSPASLDEPPGLAWYAPDNYDGDVAKTRWDGLAAQRAALAEHGADFEAFNYCDGLSYPSDDGSEWYLPALDELELIYRLLKPTTSDNNVGTHTGSDFPGTDQDYGDNPSSDPTGDPYTASDPAQTSVTDFQDGGAEAFVDPTGYYWTATWYSSSYAWFQEPDDGSQGFYGQASTSRRVRPVRRLVL